MWRDCPSGRRIDSQHFLMCIIECTETRAVVLLHAFLIGVAVVTLQAASMTHILSVCHSARAR